jgi:hypothetical protein
MGVIQFPTPIPATNGNFPNLKSALFSDNLATVTTAGYLTTSSLDAGMPLSNADVIMALYSYSQNTNSGTFGIFTVSISTSTGQVTLSSWANPGDAVLPTIANYIAHFTNTTGTISSGAANIINAGNIQAGLSGTAGTLASFPATASKGSLIVAGVANTGNTNTTVSNVAMGQASVVSIPDPANAIGRFMIGATATPFVSGNFPIASGTGGLFIDSGAAPGSFANLTAANVFSGAGQITLAKANGTESGNAVTASGNAGVITTSSLTTVGGSSYAITWTNTLITATSVILLTIMGGTNTTENITLKATAGSGTSTLTIYNNTAATSLNGTIFIGYSVL